MKVKTKDGTPILIDNRETQVLFSYFTGDEVEEDGDVSMCIIRPYPEDEDDEPTDLSVGVAVCSKFDNFNKSVGRYIAWKRAVSDGVAEGDDFFYTFDLETRKALWGWYLDNCKLPNTKYF